MNVSVYDNSEEFLKLTIQNNFRITKKCIFQNDTAPCHVIQSESKF